MKLRLALIAVATLSTSAILHTAPAIAGEETKSVFVMSRNWAVTQVADEPVIYRATRDNNNLNPYGPPPRLRTTQAIAAIQQATGCKVIFNSMYQNISGQFFSQVRCK